MRRHMLVSSFFTGMAPCSRNRACSAGGLKHPRKFPGCCGLSSYRRSAYVSAEPGGRLAMVIAWRAPTKRGSF
ncbi:hypothetical protein BHE74_00036969 [Ensete ventricosum]|nr:hypothetical protein GW17_00006922 [Ensete ventricosum]RWW56333.1 hypothetical protein BHE74_00036969 [Ensete ventricosum]